MDVAMILCNVGLRVHIACKKTNLISIFEKLLHESKSRIKPSGLILPNSNHVVQRN